MLMAMDLSALGEKAANGVLAPVNELLRVSSPLWQS